MRPALLFLALLLPQQSTASQTVPATSPAVLFTGRTLRDDAAGTVSFDWLSVQAIFSVTGATNVSATLRSTFWATPPAHAADAEPRSGGAHDVARALQQTTFPKFGVYRVYVNGVRTEAGEGGVVVNAGEAEYALASGLDPAQTYNVSLWYTTDAVFNSWPDLDLGVGCMQTVVALSTDGAFAPPPPRRARAMLIVGDSITSGNAMYLPCTNATKCDASQSYAGLLCEAFSLNCTQLTASSKGLVHNCCDKLPVTVPVLANRTFAQDNATATAWDWARTPFDAVLLHIGTNDGRQSTPDVFAAAYLSLMRNAVRESPPGTPIFCAFGPNSDTMQPWVEAAMAAGAAEGLHSTLLDFMAAPLDGCGHPGVKGHPAMARIAAPVIAAVTGWPYSEAHFPPA